MQKLAKELGVNEVKLKTAQVYDYENGNELIPTIDKYSRYRKEEGGKYTIKNSLENHCWKLWHSCVFTWDGRVEIWHGKQYQQFRESLLRTRSEIDICKNCSEGTKVWA